MNGDRRACAVQTWDASEYAGNARFVADLGEAVIELLAPQPGERILDLGCGDGALTQRLMLRQTVVVGVDSSPEFVAAACGAGLDVRLMSGEALTFEREFDAVFSNAALHWMTDCDAVLDGVRRALKPGGRFVGEFGGHGNVAAIRTALAAGLRRRGHDVPEPWYFPTADGYAQKLNEHGFRVESITLIARPTLLPTQLRGWLETFANPFFPAGAMQLRRAVMDEAIDLLAPILRDPQGDWTADYVRLRFAATTCLAEESRPALQG